MNGNRFGEAQARNQLRPIAPEPQHEGDLPQLTLRDAIEASRLASRTTTPNRRPGSLWRPRS
jgi:hypothetical protein